MERKWYACWTMQTGKNAVQYIEAETGFEARQRYAAKNHVQRGDVISRVPGDGELGRDGKTS